MIYQNFQFMVAEGNTKAADSPDYVAVQMSFKDALSLLSLLASQVGGGTDRIVTFGLLGTIHLIEDEELNDAN